MQAQDIARILSERSEQVCRQVLSGGKRKGSRWYAGNTSGSEGESLVVELEGTKAGIWSDFATGQGGDLLDLWRECGNLTMAETFAQVKSWLGIADADFHPKRERPRDYAKPAKPDCRKPRILETGEMTPGLEYLTVERKLNPDTVFKFRIAETDNAIVFPFMRDGELVHVKHLAIARENGKKRTWASKGTAPILFGWQAMPEKCRSVVLSEGEIDAMSISQIGAHALSIPMGAENDQWIELEFGRLERFDEIFIAFDNDEPGQKAALKAIERLGRHRCRLVQWPEGIKDANAALQAGWTEKDFAGAIMCGRTLDPDELRNAADFRDAVMLEFYPPADKPIGIRTPWGKVGDKLLFRPAQTTLWTGINGHGKSLVLSQIVVNSIAQGERSCIASMEMKPAITLRRMVQQASCLAKPSRGYIDNCIDWMKPGLWLFDVVGTAKTAKLIEVFSYARRRYGVTQFVVDSLAKCGIDEEDYSAQKRFVELLVDFAHEFDVHVHLVAHSRKGRDEYDAPGKMDVKGSGGMTDMVDNVVTVWRNKKKEEAIKAAPGEDIDESIVDKPDAAAIVSKQRHTGWEDKIWLWFDEESLQYMGHSDGRPIRYVGYSEQAAA